MKRTLLAAVMAAFVVPGAIPSATAAPIPPIHARHARAGCRRTYRIAYARRAANRVYHQQHVTRRDQRWLATIERCQRNPHARGFVRWLYRQARSAWRQRTAPLSAAVASWYDDAGTTASGWHAYYGVAVCGSGGGPCVAFGTRILFCYPYGSRRCVVATADDHGPYVAGRAFDLNEHVAQALGFGGVGVVGYRIL